MTLLQRIGRGIRDMPPALVLALGWLVLIVYAFPGQMSWDSFEYLHGARNEGQTDLHPPAISALWSLVELFVAGPTGMLIVQSTAFLIGLYLLLGRVTSPRRAAWIASALFVFPPVMVPMAAIWGHSLMAGFLLLGTALLVAGDRRARIGGLAALALATAVRPSALVATLPLVLVLFEWRPLPALRRHALAGGAWLAITAVALGTNALLTERAAHRWASSTVVHDIAGTLRYVKRDVPDAELARILDGTELQVTTDLHRTFRERYSPFDERRLIEGPGAPWAIAVGVDATVPAAQAAALERARRTLIADHLGAYLRHRTNVWLKVLGFSKYKPPAVLPRVSIAPEVSLLVGVPTHASDLQHGWSALMVAFAESTPLFAPWCYLVIALLLVPLVIRQREALALVVSGIAAELALFVIASDHHFRQSHWLVTCTCVVAAITAIRVGRLRS